MSETSPIPVNEITADRINTHLADGGIVQVSTYGSSTIYKKRNAGQFFNGVKSGNLYVRRGKSSDCLTMDSGKCLMVSIRFGRIK